MAKTEYTIWSCDVCGRKYQTDERPRELEKVDLAGMQYDCEGRRFTYGAVPADLCPECVERLFDITAKHFAIAEDTPGGRRIRKVNHDTEG